MLKKYGTNRCIIFLCAIIVLFPGILYSQTENLLELINSTSTPESYKSYYQRCLEMPKIQEQINEKRASRSKGLVNNSLAQSMFNTVDSTGPVVDIENKFSLSFIRYLTGLVQSPDGSFYVSGTGYNPSASQYVVILAKINSLGVKVWDRSFYPAGYYNEATGITTDDEGNIYVSVTEVSAQKALIFKFNGSGSIVNSVELPIDTWDSPYINGVVFNPQQNAIYATVDQWCQESEYTRGVKIFTYTKNLDFTGSAIILDEGQKDEYSLPGIAIDLNNNIYTGGPIIKYEGGYEQFLKNITSGEISHTGLTWQGRYFGKIARVPNGGAAMVDSEGNVNVQKYSVTASLIWVKSFTEELDAVPDYNGIDADSEGNVYTGGYDLTDWYARIIKSSNSTGDKVFDVIYDKGYGVELIKIDSEAGINVIGWGENAEEFFFVRYKEEVVDTTPPALITDLAIADCSVTANSITLKWTAPGDDGAIGDIENGKYGIIYDDNIQWTSPEIIEFSTNTGPGAKETYKITGLEQGTKYYFAIKTADEVPSWSGISNVASARTFLNVPYFCQQALPWADDPYGETGRYNIGEFGCMLTCYTMIINYYHRYLQQMGFSVDFATTTPGDLNNWIKNRYLYRNENISLYFIAIYTNEAVRLSDFGKVRNLSIADQIINEDLANKRPPMVSAYPFGDTSKNLHAFVPIGSCSQGFILNDPIDPAWKDLVPYNNKYQYIYRFTSESGDPSAFSDTIYSHAEVCVKDSQGRRLGYDVATGEILEEIPNSCYAEQYFSTFTTTDIGSKPKVLSVFKPSKDYYIHEIIGISTGSYSITFDILDSSNNFTTKNISRATYPGKIDRLFVNYNVLPGEQIDIFEDNTPPITKLVISSTGFKAFDTVYIPLNTMLGFEATDSAVGEGTSGVKYSEYRINGSSWTTYASAFSILSDGEHLIEYRSIDNAGNIEEIKSAKVIVTLISEYATIGINSVTLTGKINVQGNIRSNENVSIKGRVVVDGNVYAEKVKVTRSSRINGSVIENAPNVSPFPIELAGIIEGVVNSNDNESIPLTQRGKDAVDNLGRLTLGNKDSLALSSGAYYFTGINLTGKSELKANGNVNIVCSGDVKIIGRAKINAGSPADKFVIFVSTSIFRNCNRVRFFENICDNLCMDDVFDRDELREFRDNRDDDFDSELDIDHRGRINCIRNRNARIPGIYIAGCVDINSIIYAPKSKVLILGYTKYEGTIFANDIKVAGLGTIKSLIPPTLLTPSTRNQGNGRMRIAVNTDIAYLCKDLRSAYPYPNPCKADNQNIIFTNLTAHTTLKIYTISGRLVYETDQDTPTGQLIWETKNQKAESVTNGVYIYIITNPVGEKKTGKLAIRR